MSNALVPSSSSPSPFPQQGQVDWVALSNQTVNFSVAALQRFAKAGVDPYTIQVGKALCFHLRLEPHVQDMIVDAIKKLKKYGVCGDALWFGFGIKQVITDLSETEEGLSLVALCAALLTSYGTLFSALVLREMCAHLQMPKIFMPSQPQWRAFLRLCSGILMGSQFELVLEGFRRILRIVPQPSNDPQCVADIICELALVQKKATVHLSITGGADCSWLAAFAERILCLDIALLGHDGQVYYRSQSRKDEIPEVTFFIGADIEDILHVSQKTSLLSRGCKLIHNDNNINTQTEVSYRCSWSHLLQETFRLSDDVCHDQTYLDNLVCFLHEFPSTNLTITSPGILCAVQELSRSLLWHQSLPSGYSFIAFAASILPELRPSFNLVKRRKSNFTDDLRLRIENLVNSQGASDHTCSLVCETESCALLDASTVLLFLRIIHMCDIDKEVLPSSLGLHFLRRVVLSQALSPGRILAISTPFIYDIFSGPTGRKHSPELEYQRTLAKAGRGVCVYRSAIEEPLGSLELLARWRIVKGYVTYNNQRYVKIADLPSVSETEMWRYDSAQYPNKIEVAPVEILINQTSGNQVLEVGFLVRCPRRRVVICMTQSIYDLCKELRQPTLDEKGHVLGCQSPYPGSDRATIESTRIDEAQSRLASTIGSQTLLLANYEHVYKVSGAVTVTFGEWDDLNLLWWQSRRNYRSIQHCGDLSLCCLLRGRIASDIDATLRARQLCPSIHYKGSIELLHALGRQNIPWEIFLELKRVFSPPLP